MAETGKKYTFSVEIDTEDGESDLRRTLKDVQLEFNGISFTLKAGGKQLIPTEVIVDVTIAIASTVTAGVILRMLEKLWQRLKENKLNPKTAELDAIQSFAEGYLESIGVTSFTILKRINKGPYVKFTYRDEKKHLHFVDVASFKPQVLNYEKSE